MNYFLPLVRKYLVLVVATFGLFGGASSVLAATVTNVTTSAANGTYHAGYPVSPIAITFSQTVTVTGTPRILLETGTTDRYASYYEGSGGTTLYFNSYIVQAGDSSSDLDYASTSALELNGGTIKHSGVDATLTLPSPGASGSLGANKAIVINTSGGVTVGDNDASPLGVGLEGLAYYMGGNPFINSFKTSTAFWYTFGSSGWDTGQQQYIDVDSNGWPVTLTPLSGGNFIKVGRAIFNGREGNYPGGRYVVLYDGEGTLTYEWDGVKNNGLSAPGRDVIDINSTTNLGVLIDITATDPNNNGEYIRNIAVMRESDEAAYNTGSRFTPEFLDATKKYREIRFMDWMATNGSLTQNWSERTQVNDVSYAPDHDNGVQGGAPVETMMDLANTLHADPWVNMPHKANDAYITQFADLAHSLLDTDRKIYVEWSNEVWNSGFQQYLDAAAAGAALGWGGQQWERAWNYLGKRTAETCDIWKAEWGVDSDRVVCVMGGQASGSWVNDNEILSCPLWTGSGGDCAGTHGIDALAIAPYFGGDRGYDPGEDAGLDDAAYDWVTNDPDNALDNLFYALTTSTSNVPGAPSDAVNGYLEESHTWMTDNKVVADAYGIDMISYEGGQHLVDEEHRDSTNLVTNLYIQANNDPRMYDAYITELENWKSAGGKVFSQFTDIGSWSKYGMWGSYQYSTDTPTDYEKFNALHDFIDDNTCWWTGCLMTINGTDTTAPTITNVSSDKTNGSYTVGEVIDIDVTFSEAVTSTGNVTVTLETGATDRTCTFTVTNSTTGTCNYTVQSGDTSSDLTTNSISGTIADQASNAMSNFTPATNLAANKALVIDTTNPTVSSLSPTDGATGVSTTANLVMTFDAAVVVGTGNITIKLASDNSTVEAIAVGSGQVTGGGTSTITINPSVTLSGSTDYYVQVASTAFDDVAGNSYAGISNTTSWNFTTVAVDSTPPTITNVSSDKANGSYTVGEVIDIDVTFSEAVTSTGNVTVTLETGTTDRTCTFTVSNSTTGTCNYTVQSGDTSSDLTTNSISGTINDQSSNAMVDFTPATNLAANKALVIDTTNPTVSTLSPADNATGVSATANLVMTFDAAVVVGTGNITIKLASDNSTVEAIAVGSGQVTGSGTSIITIDPSVTLGSSTAYYVQVAATAFDDVAGNSYAGIANTTSWNFTTADSTAPTILSVSSDKANGSYTVGEIIDIDVTFSEAVTSTGNVTVTLETGTTDRTCTFTVSNATTGTCNYTVQSGDTSSDLTTNSISGTIADQASNAMSNFTPATNLAANKALVIDTTNPTVSSLSPTDGATGVSTGANLILTFDAAVNVGTGNVTIKKSSDDSTVEAISVTGLQVTGTGTSTITVNPSVTLAGLTDYYVQVDATAFDDVAGNSYAGISDTTSWNFTTATTDTTPPTILSVSSDKANGSYTVGEVIDIDVTFSEAVTSTGNVTVTLETGTTDRTCTFTVSNSATGTCNYTVQTGDTSSDLTTNNISGTINDQSSNTMVNFTPGTTLAANKALVIDTANPSISSFSPADNATGISATANLVMNFDAAVTVQTGNITIKKSSDNSTVETIAVTSGQVTGTGTSAITIDPSVTLGSSTGYYVQVAATAFDDVAGNSYAGISDTTTWNFTTADSTAPTILSVSSDKANGSYTVGAVIDIDVTFSEAVTSTGNVTVTLETGTTDRTCTFTVTNATTGTCDYTVQSGDTSSDLTTNSISGTIADQSSNAMSDFTPATNLAANKALIIDTTNPTVSSLSPTDGATGVSPTANLVMTFDAAVVVGTGNVTIKKSSDDSTVEAISVTGARVTGSGSSTITINPSVTLGSVVDYYVQVDATAFDDVAGNSYAGISDTTSWNFTTDVDTTDPSVSSLSPSDNAFDAAITSDLVITFTETVDVETGNIVLKKNSDDSVVETIDVTSGQVTGTGTDTITINPSADLLYSTGYYVQIDVTAFDDGAGNSYAGINDSTTWNFTTAAEDSSDNGDDHEKLEVSDVEYSVTDTTLTVKWKTNNEADSQVRYGTNRNLREEKTDSDNEKKHEMTIKELASNTRYYFRVHSEDEYDSDDSSKTYSVTTAKSESSESTGQSEEATDTDSTPPVTPPATDTSSDTPSSGEESKPVVTSPDANKDLSQDTQKEVAKEYDTEIFTESGQQYIKEVKFQIVDNDDKPLSYVPITLHSEPRTSMTDDQGIVTFNNVPTGEHRLLFAYAGEEIEKSIEVQGAETGDGPVKAEMLVIRAEKDPLPLWVWGAFAGLALLLVIAMIFVFRRKRSY